MLASRLFDKESDQIEFILGLKDESLAQKASILQQPLDCPDRPSWVPTWVAPGKEPDIGEYAVDLSFVWRMTPMGHIQPPRRILDLCAAPGGTSIMAHRYFPNSELICNDISLSRSEMLYKNLTSNLGTQKGVSITSLHSDEWLDLGEKCFDLVILDPPSSEQAKLGSDPSGQVAFDPVTIRGNAERQIDILRDALKLVTPGGHLIYTTSTFSIAENEFVLNKVLSEIDGFLACDLGPVFRSQHLQAPCYRLFPQNGLGLGGFTALIKHEGVRADLPSISGDTEGRQLGEE